MADAHTSSTVQRMMVTYARRHRMLGQLRPANTNAASIYTPPSNQFIGIVTAIFVCNTGAAALNFSIFHHNTGTTYDQTTALFYVVALNNGATFSIALPSEIGLPVVSGGNIAVQTGTANDATFTVYGYELDVRS